MRKESKVHKKELIDKVKVKVKVGYISVALIATLYIIFSVIESLNPNVSGMSEWMIFFLLVCVALYILDGYKLIVEVLQIIDIKR
ncbi:hypothetical protein [Halonatronum saccharophilum]|uniref:hypothetical protein n=1 Tax=Halonatronum saccharophilum TaxID=150060 RepID=UPI000484B588|nr:hypothetical protein [Halonatronum saccharophilum]